MTSLASTTLKMGDPCPDFTLPDLDGRPFELSDVLQGGSVLLIFAPGAWSTNTLRLIVELEAIHPRLDSLGVYPLLIVTQSAQGARRTLQTFFFRPERNFMRPTLSFPILVYQTREVAQDYGVFRAFSLDGFRVTRPAVFLIDPAGWIAFIYVGSNDADLPDASTLVHLVTGVAGSRFFPIGPLVGSANRLIQGWDVSALPKISKASELPELEQSASAIALPAARTLSEPGALLMKGVEETAADGNGRP